MTDADGNVKGTGAFGFRLAGDAIDEVDDRGKRAADDTLLILLNPQWKSVQFVLPIQSAGTSWEMLLDTRQPLPPRRQTVKGGAKYRLMARSLALVGVPLHSDQ